MSGIDLTARARPYSLYFPSMQIGSAQNLVMHAADWQSSPLPGGLQPTDFNYLESDNRFWTYKYALASAETFRDSDKNAVTGRDAASFILADSGGFQYGKGSGEASRWKGLDEASVSTAWRTSRILEKVTEWCDLQADYAMTLDLPLWVKRPGNKSPFNCCTAATLLQLTIENLRYVDLRRQAGKTTSKYLNVLQGDKEADEEWWYQAVRTYKFDGWSLAGGIGTDGGPYRMIRRLLRMRDDGLLGGGLDWVHVLKQTQPRWAPLLTAMQKALRKSTGAEHFTISYDSSTPYQVGGKHEKYAERPLLDGDLATWHFKFHKFPTSYGFANQAHAIPLDSMTCTSAKCGMCAQSKAHLPAPLESPIAKILTIQDLLTRKGNFDPRRVGRLFEETIINHNVYTVVEGLIRANEAVFGPKPHAPSELIDAAGEIERIFETEDWDGLLNAKRVRLEQVVGFRPFKHVI